MEARRPLPARPLPRLGSPALVPLALLALADRRLRRVRRSGARAQRRAGRGASRSSAPCCIPGEIELHAAATTGRTPCEIVQAIVNDGFAAFEQDDDELGRLDRSTGDDRRTRGSRARPTRSSLLTSTGGTIDKSIEVAAETPEADAGFYGLMGLIGLYVGIIPIAHRDALAAVDAAARQALAAVPARADDRPARLPRDRRGARGPRPRRVAAPSRSAAAR